MPAKRVRPNATDTDTGVGGRPWPWRRVDATLIATARRIRHAYDQVLADLGVTMPEAALLAYVLEAGPLTQTRLARGLDSGRAATGLRVDALEARGFLQRQANPTDRRVWMVVATPAGAELVAWIDEVDLKFRDQLRAGISRADRDLFASVLLRMQANLKEIISTAEDAPPIESAQ